jgi:hypothetical protein
VVSVLPRLCRTCGGGSPLDDNPCTCGSKWAPEPDDGPPDWEMLFHQLLVRSGRRCEARTPWCVGMPRDGYIGHLVRQQTSIQHRRPRRSGGSRRPDTHSLANLMVLCGTGNTGCHGYIETKERAVALRRGYLLHDGQDPAREPVILPSNRVVWLDPSGLYVDVSDPPTFDLDVPGWPGAA